MNIRKTNAWKAAEWEYEQLNAVTMIQVFGKPLSSEEIIDRLEMVLEECPEFYPALLDMGTRRLAISGKGEAERQIDEGFHLMLELAKPEHMEEELDILLENLETLWRFDLSRHCLEVLVERYPQNALFQDYIAHATARMGDIDGALDHIAKAVQLEPDNPHFKSNQGWLHLMAGNLKDAGQFLEEALHDNPDDEVVKGNLEIHKYLSEHGGNYFDYLLRPVDQEKIDRLEDEEDWEEIEKIYASHNNCRFEAMAQAFLQGDSRNLSRLADLLSTLKVFFGFVRKVDQDNHLNEDIDFIHEYFKPIMHKFIFKFSDIDHEMIEEIYGALIEYYGFLASRDLVSTKDFKRFQRKILGMKKELIGKMERYNEIRHNDEVDAKEKEAIREKLFEGDHDWPFL